MLSIIIPTYNEEANIRELLAYLKKHIRPGKAEIIIADGGSTDHTREAAKKHGARVLISPQKGRASQMNYGAKKARGEVLYFLHADTFPPHDFTGEITRKIEAGFSAGCFRLKFDDDHWALRLFSWFTRFNVDFFRFGDQSLFVKKALFQKIKGFCEDLMVMEDQEIVRRLKSHAQFAIIKKGVITSARKYQRIGVFRLQLIFSIIVILYYGRISQEVIVHFYQNFTSGARN